VLSTLRPSGVINVPQVVTLILVHNTILKYADDTSLLVPQNSSVTLETEFAHIGLV